MTPVANAMPKADVAGTCLHHAGRKKPTQNFVSESPDFWGGDGLTPTWGVEGGLKFVARKHNYEPKCSTNMFMQIGMQTFRIKHR